MFYSIKYQNNGLTYIFALIVGSDTDFSTEDSVVTTFSITRAFIVLTTSGIGQTLSWTVVNSYVRASARLVH